MKTVLYQQNIKVSERVALSLCVRRQVGVLTHFGAVGSQLQNPLSLPDVRRSHLKGNLEYPPWALLPPRSLLGVAEEVSGGVQRSHELVALSCAWSHHDIHDGLCVPPALPVLLYCRPAKASPASWASSPPLTPASCSFLWSSAWITSETPQQYSLTGKLEEGRKKIKKNCNKERKELSALPAAVETSVAVEQCEPGSCVGLRRLWQGAKKGGRNIAYSRNFWACLPSKLICEQELGFYQLPSPSGTGKGC